MLTQARFTARPVTVFTKLTRPSEATYKFQSLTLSTAATMTIVPSHPVEDVTIATTLLVRKAWASSTPTGPITHSPSVIPTTVCLTTSAGDRLNLVMSGVITAPTMN